MVAFVYLVMCLDDTIYTGIAHDLTRRITQHRTKKGARWTRSHGFKYYTFFEVPSFGIATIKEREIKKFSRDKKVNLFEKFGIFYT